MALTGRLTHEELKRRWKKKPKPEPKPRPMTLVCSGGQIMGSAIVIVSEKDPNWYKGPKAVLTDGVVTVLHRRI